MNRNKRLLLVSTATVAIVGVCILFRKETTVNQLGHKIRKEWRWGSAYSLSVDRDRDGRYEIVAWYNWGDTTFFSDVPPNELWRDRDGNGRFEERWTFGPPLELILVADDGTEQKLSGPALAPYLSDGEEVRLPQP